MRGADPVMGTARKAAARLCPAQRAAFRKLLDGHAVANILCLNAGDGMGKTTLLRALHEVVGGQFLTIREFVEDMHGQHPLALEETFTRLLFDALASHDTVIVDDLHLITSVVNGGYCSAAYPRSGYLNAGITAATAYTIHSGKRLICGAGGLTAEPLWHRGFTFGIEELTAEDYAFICRAYLTRSQAARLDYGRIFRFAPHLDVRQLELSCVWLRRAKWGDARGLDTERYIDFLRSNHMSSNVDLDEVQRVDLQDLKGVDAVIRSLEANIVLPLENDALSVELNLKPKRGVLLAGPPGTGKTTVGRALAHRLKSKFFLIDGTFISGTDRFYAEVGRIFEAAKENAPSVIFIDDSDVIFESGEESGLYRYLLTMLDGLESEEVGQVCVMLTAMDVGNLPPALMRSGRVELWLEMALPDGHARREILRDLASRLPEAFTPLDLTPLVEATEGFTGADLKRLMEDGKLLFGFDRQHGRPMQTPTEYFLAAVMTVLENRARYSAAAARTRQQHPSRPPWFSGFDHAVSGT